MAYVGYLNVKRSWSGGKGAPVMMIALGPSDLTVYNLLDWMGREKILFKDISKLVNVLVKP